MDWVDNQLTLCLESEGLGPLAPTTMAKKRYEKLVEMHCEVNVSINAFYNFLELSSLHWDVISGIEDHISHFSAINSKLTLLKKPIDDFFLAMFLLQSLPTTASWETFKSSVLNSLPPGTNLSFSTLENCIVAEALCLKGSSSNPAVLELALKVSKDKKQLKSQKQKNCKLHGTGGHSTKECFTLKWKSEQEAKEKKKKKKKEKAHRAEEVSTLEDSGSTSDDSGSEDVHISRALMARIRLCRNGT
ncbi:hypothetical protein K439DRAFT_1619909 [Ramaria rubella]|nr:hypothetical protein K439DRAFT_1619909 [Ramaria rubella]